MAAMGRLKAIGWERFVVQKATLARERGERLCGSVSRDAPARRATSLFCASRRSLVVSIHAPAQGATPDARAAYGGEQRFDPRPRAGGDRRGGPQLRGAESFDPRPRAGGDAGVPSSRMGRRVSIHAPARGATRLANDGDCQ
jgi:hypothetical protein